MKFFSIATLALLLCSVVTAAAAKPAAYTDLEWRDARRDRVVPVRIYLDRNREKPRPVMIFSHGLGGSREGYEYLAEFWSKAGWLVVMVEHQGSNRDVLRSAMPMAAMRRAAADPANAVNRPKDISFVIDMLAQLNQAEGTWQGWFDLKQIGVGGHSFGAYTAQAIAGMNLALPDGTRVSFADPRVKAALVLSPTAGRRQMLRGDQALADMKIPCFFLTGTKDDSPINDTSAAERRWVFDHARNTRFLLTFIGGDHMVFSGRRRIPRLDGSAGSSDAVIQQLTAQMSLLFLNAFVRDDRAALAEFLRSGEKAAADKIARWETHRAPGQSPANVLPKPILSR